jgi:hypothetical protein
VGVGRVNREGGEEQIRWMYFVNVYENTTMKLTGIVLRLERGMRENDGGGKLKKYCKHICQCHNVSPYATTICTLKNFKKSI